MVKTKLVEALVSDGARLLRELDRQAFPVESMFWVHLPDADYWRLVIASTVVSEQGGRAAYRRLHELLQKVPLAGITLEDISLLDLASPQLESFTSLARGTSRLTSGPEWAEFEAAVVYRWIGISLTGELTCEVSSEELYQIWEAERKIVNLPALIVRSDGRRVTLRFHPQHGPLGGIDKLKTNFQIALHRPNARPGCQVKWLD